MACEPAALSALAYARGFTLWHYRTPDPAAEVVARPVPGIRGGYFDDAADMLRPGDRMFLDAGMSDRGTFMTLFVVSAGGGEVVVADAAGYLR